MRPFVFIFLFLVASAAYADEIDIGPEGWAKSQSGEMIQYTSPHGRERVVVRRITSTDDPLDAAQQIVTGLGGLASDCRLVVSGQASECDATVPASGFDLRLRAYVIDKEQYLIGLLHMGADGAADLEARMDESGGRILGLLGKSSTPLNPRQPQAPPPSASTGSFEPEHVLFDLSYSYGVGGAAYPRYRPIYLFSDGRSCLCPDLAPGDVSLSDLERTRPENIGHWRRTGTKFSVRYPDGDVDELNPSIGPPAHIPNGRLYGRFGAIGGGGNSALGGSTTVIASKEYDFKPDGTFVQGKFGGGGNRSVTAGSKRTTFGTWSLNGATLSLTYEDGRQIRTSVYWDSKDDLVGGIPDAIWIGGRAYRRKD